MYKKALDAKLIERGLPPEWSDVIYSEAQNDEAPISDYNYGKAKQDDLIDCFKLTPTQWEERNLANYGSDRSAWRPPLKILIVCDRLLTGFDAPVESVMYLDKPLRDHNLLQAVARTNRPLPAMDKKTGVIVDYFGVFDNLEKALNFDESVREEALIDWDVLRATVPHEVERTIEPFDGLTISDTRDCLLAALRRLAVPEVAKAFEGNFKSLERFWEALSPDPCLYGHRTAYRWLCGIYIAHRRRVRGPRATFGELAAKTLALIQANTSFMRMVEELPLFKIDGNTVANLDALPPAADKAAALEAALTRELSEDGEGFAYRLLGERLQKLKERRDATDVAAAERLRELANIAEEAAENKSEPERRRLNPGAEFRLFTVLKAFAPEVDPEFLAECARGIVANLREFGSLPRGWSRTRQGRMDSENSLKIETWKEVYSSLPLDTLNPESPFLRAAVDELALSDG